jgi:hypothetical protein
MKKMEKGNMGGAPMGPASRCPPPPVPLAHIAWDGVASESPTGKLVWSVASCPKARRSYTAARSPEGDPHVFPLVNPSQNPKQSMICQLRGAVCSPSLSGPKTVPLSTLRG